MALIFKCDRCGTIIGDKGFDGNGNGPFVWDTDMAPDQEHFDLCENCYNSLIRWIHGENPPKNCNDDCEGCKFIACSPEEEPCRNCSHNFINRWRPEND